MTPSSADTAATLADERLGTAATRLDARRGARPSRRSLGSGTVLGKYRIGATLGEGGMSTVFEATHVDLGRTVAVKVLSPSLNASPVAQQRFAREAASASRLEHPHVVSVTDFGVHDGAWYLVMERLRGEDLRQVLSREGRLPADRLADVMLAVCAGVAAAHEIGIVHRDLKPENVFLARDATGDEVPKVLDFGISKQLGSDEVGLTRTGTLVGTPEYLSPEQIAGGPIDVRADQWAMGVMLYEASVGHRPYQAATSWGVVKQVVDHILQAPRQVCPDVSRELEAIILRCLSRDPGQRFESVSALAAALLPLASPRARARWGGGFDRAAVDPPVVVEPSPVATVLLPNVVSALPLTITMQVQAPAIDSSPDVAVGGGGELPDWVTSPNVTSLGVSKASGARRVGARLVGGALAVVALLGAVSAAASVFRERASDEPTIATPSAKVSFAPVPAPRSVPRETVATDLVATVVVSPPTEVVETPDLELVPADASRSPRPKAAQSGRTRARIQIDCVVCDCDQPERVPVLD